MKAEEFGKGFSYRMHIYNDHGADLCGNRLSDT